MKHRVILKVLFAWLLFLLPANGTVAALVIEEEIDEVTVTMDIDAPPAEIFDMLTDYANWSNQYTAIQDSELLREGIYETNGVGAKRRLVAFGCINFIAVIPTFDRSTYTHEYLIQEIFVPLAGDFRIDIPFTHEQGLIEIFKIDKYTSRVRWYTRGKVDWIPNFLGRITFNWLFSSILRDTKQALE